nr:polyprotein [Brassica napus RNA virus 1]
MSSEPQVCIDNLNRISTLGGIIFSLGECDHRFPFSADSVVSCNVCNFLLRLNKKQQKNSTLVSRLLFEQVAGCSFARAYQLSRVLCGVDKVDHKFLDNAKSAINCKLGYKYGCALYAGIGTSSQATNYSDSWNMCDNAEHLFECFSLSDQTRGRLFTVPGESVGWHTTCAKCGASCSFAGPREALIIILFLRILRVRYDGNKYLVSSVAGEKPVHCSRKMATVILIAQDCAIDLHKMEIVNDDPQLEELKSDVYRDECSADHFTYGTNIVERYAKNDFIKTSSGCLHQFYLVKCPGVQLKMSHDMMRVLMMLLPCSGYLNALVKGEDGMLRQVLNASGLLSAGGFVGVNVRCNEGFVQFHQEFYRGSFRSPVTETPLLIDEENFVAAEPIVHVCTKQSSGGYDSSQSEEDEDFGEDDVDAMQEKFDAFLNEPKSLLEVEDVSRVQGRGLGDLKKRVGGLLKGVTNCVKACHAVWDWPLDTALNLIGKTGDWLEENKEYVSKDVWSCTVCNELQKDMSAGAEEQKKINQLFKAMLEKLAKTVDEVTAMNNKNFAKLEEKLPSDDQNLVVLRKKMELMQDELTRHAGDIHAVKTEVERMDSNLGPFNGEACILSIAEIKVDMQEMRERLNQLEREPKGSKLPVSIPPPRDRPRPTPTSSDAGEQMPIPRMSVMDGSNVKQPPPGMSKSRQARWFEKQMLMRQSGSTEFVGTEMQAEVVESSRVVARGRTEEHNPFLSKLYLGSVSWSVSDGEGTVLQDFDIPSAVWGSNSRLADILSYFQYYTVDGMDFYVTLTSIGMQGGTLMLVWDALSCATRQKTASVFQLSNLPKAFIHASESAEQVFSIDSPSIQHQMCTSGSEGSLGNLGTLKICIANVLNASSETSQSASVNVWLKFRNPKMSLYTRKHELVMSQACTDVEETHGLESCEAMIATGKWSTTSSTNLMELTVHPTACHLERGMLSQTSLSVIASMFGRWRGSLRFKFVFGASMFVKGKVAVSAIPIAFRKEKLSVAQLLSFPSVICDLNTANKEFIFDVPYNSIGEDSYVTRDSLYDMSCYNGDFVVSRLHMVVLDPLVMNANASNAISFFVMMGPGDDFTLSQLLGVKSEYVNRNLKQAFGRSLNSGGLNGDGFSRWCGVPSVLAKFELNADKKNALHFMISPYYRRFPPCVTSLSWLSQIFVEWRGSLQYTLRAHSQDRAKGSLVRIWHDANGSTISREEFEFLSDVDPPSGMRVLYWNPVLSDTYTFTVPYRARTKKLIIMKARYEPHEYDWVRCYNGSVVIDFEGPGEMSLELSVSAGSDFEMFEQTVAPRCGNVTKAFTVLSYKDKLCDITVFPKNTGRLGGPVNRADVMPLKYQPVHEVETPPRVKDRGKDAEGREVGPLNRLPVEGERAFTKEGDPIIFRNGQWDYEEDEVTSQMNCFPRGLKGLKESADLFETRDTCSKLADVIDFSHETVTEKGGMLDKLRIAAESLGPLMEKAEKAMGTMEEKMDFLTSCKDKVMGVLSSLFTESVPGTVLSMVENQQYTWATLLTIIGGASLLWTSKSEMKFYKKLSVFAMIVWSPFLASKTWALGKWVKTKFTNFFHRENIDEETCRKHSMAGAFEEVKKYLGNFSEWFSDNWMSTIQALLSLLCTVASLIVWGTMPDTKQLNSFTEKFKVAGEKGRSFSNIFSGFNSITKMSNEMSSAFMKWTMQGMKDSLPNADSALQTLVTFDIREWIKETRVMALQENRFQGFGGEEHLVRVRHLYDKSQAIEQALASGVRVDTQLSMIIKDCKEKCTELKNESYTFKGMKKPRIDPLHVCMLGKPGVGKSTITHVVINNLLDHRGEPETDRIYTRCCADAYWSNYHQEPVVLYDDLGAIKSSLKLSDYAEIMGVKTNDPFSVPMAGVEDKGKHCTSRYVFSCTNVLELDDSGDVVSKLAYYRRRNILVEVERDERVPRDESNPTAGLIFTVLGYHIVDERSGRVAFGIKEAWEEPFLRDIDTSQWRFERVSYPVFLRFLCVYTDAYMASQENLLTGITCYRPDMEEIPTLDEIFPVVAQAGGALCTLGDVIEQFDKRGLSGRDLCASFQKRGSKYFPPDAWGTSKSMSFNKLILTLCECSDQGVCNFDIMMSQIRELSVQKDVKRIVRAIRVHKLKAEPLETEMMVNGNGVEGLFEEVDALTLFSMLACWYRWSLPGYTCVYRINQQVSAQRFAEKCRDEVESEDRIPNRVEINVEDGNSFVWDKAMKFFPSCLSTTGCVPLFDGCEYYLASTSLSMQRVEERRSEVWELIWANGVEILCDPLSLLPRRERLTIAGIVNGISSFGTAKEPSEEVKQVYQSIKENYGLGNIYLTTIILVAQAHSDHAKKMEKAKNNEKKEKVFSAYEKLQRYEKSVVEGISGKMKVFLSIAGGIAATGTIVGLFFLVKKLFSPKSEEVSTEEIEVEDAEAEMSGAHESGMFKTAHIKTRSFPVRVARAKAEMMGAHESGAFRTEHVRRVQRPYVQKAQAHMKGGVHYDEVSELNRNLVIEKRKKKRNLAIRAASQAVKKDKRSVRTRDSIDAIDLWQNSLIQKGMLASNGEMEDVEKALIEKKILREEKHSAEGSYITGDPEFRVHYEIVEELEKARKAVLRKSKELIENGMHVTVEKQSTIGSFGMNRDENMVRLLRSHVSKMSCTILIKRGSFYQSFMVLRLKGTMVLSPAHYFEEIEEKDEIYFICPHKVVRIQLEMSRVALVSAHQDLVVWDLGKSAPPSIDYMSHIPTRKDWEVYRPCSGALAFTEYTQDMTLQMVSALDMIEMTTTNVEVPTAEYEMLESTHTVILGLRYRVHCMVGFCGAAIVRADAKAIRKIIGMHVAGNVSRGVGYAEMLIKETIQTAIDALSKEVVQKAVDEPAMVVCEKQCATIEGKGNIGQIGMIEDRLLPKMPSKTTICKSLIHGLIGDVVSEPSILSKWDRRLGEKRGMWDPVEDAVKKYGTMVVPFPREEVKEVEEHLIRVFAKRHNSLNKREVNSLEIGINGIDQTPFHSPIEMKTSAGYPYVLRTPSGASGKKWLFKEVGQYPSGRARYEMEDLGLITSYEEMLGQIKRGVAPTFITVEHPKDERRKLKKIYEVPATRTFTILPPEVNILFRQYFGDFAAMVMENRFDTFSQVGINPESLEWSELMNSLMKKGKRGFAGDYAKFDGIGSPEIYHSIVSVVNAWYDDGEENALARHALISSIVHRDGIAGAHLLRYSQGMPSGFSMTVIFNSFVNYYYMALAWMYIVSRSELSPQADLGSFDKFTKIIVYGDDNVVAVNDAFLDVYNLQSVACYLSLFGITYTDDAKNPIHLSEPHVPIDSVTFLKRSFVKLDKSGSLWKAPLDKASIEERCNWIRECEEPEEALNQNLESALYEASVHGEGYFDDLKARVDGALERVMLPTRSESFKSCQVRWWSNMTGAMLSQPSLASLVELSNKNHIDLSYKFKNMALDGVETTLGQALGMAKNSPFIYYDV